MGGKEKSQCYLLSSFQTDVRFLHESDTYKRNSKARFLIHYSCKYTGYHQCLKTKIFEIFNRLGEEGVPLCPIQYFDVF